MTTQELSLEFPTLPTAIIKAIPSMMAVFHHEDKKKANAILKQARAIKKIKKWIKKEQITEEEGNRLIDKLLDI